MLAIGDIFFVLFVSSTTNSHYSQFSHATTDPKYAGKLWDLQSSCINM